MAQTDIVISEFIDPDALAQIGGRYSVHYDPALVDNADQLSEFLATARGLIVRNRTQVRRELLESAPKLIVVGRLGVGLDNIDLAACESRGIAVCPATGANAAAVAEYVIGAALLLVRGVFGASSEVAAGNWPRTRLMGGEIGGRTLGLYGFGGIAREVSARARSLGMRVAAHDPHLAADDPAWEAAERLGPQALLAEADVLSLHLPLTAETRGLIGADALAAMKPGAVLINSARGGIVDAPALATALRSGHLGGAALDVFAEEPLSAAAGAVFAGVPNLILTPHIAGVTVEANRRVSAVTVANVLAKLDTA